MKAGTKLSLYVSRAVACDLALLLERSPGATASELVRRALAGSAQQAFAEIEATEIRDIERAAYGLIWN